MTHFFPKVMASIGLCSLLFSMPSLAAISSVDNVGGSPIPTKVTGDTLNSTELNAIVDTIRGFSHDDNGTVGNEADDILTFDGQICDGASGACLSASQWADVTDGLNYPTGKVGLGAPVPLGTLHINRASGPAAVISKGSYGWTPNASDDLVIGDGTAYWGIDAGDSFQIGREGSNHLFISNTGNLGIGSAASVAKLEVDGDLKLGDTTATCDAAKDGAVKFKDGYIQLCTDEDLGPLGGSTGGATLPSCLDEEIMIYNTVSAAWECTTAKFTAGSTASDAVFTGGNVGIGTTNPSSVLQIGDFDTGTNNQMIRISGGGSGSVEGAQIQLYTAADHDANVENYNIDVNAEFFRIFRQGPGVSGTGTEFMMDDSGNIGIGATPPQTKLHIDGSGGSNAPLRVTHDTAYAGISFENSGTSGALPSIYGTNNDLTFWNSGTQRMVIKDNGAVGISNTAPAAALHVNPIVSGQPALRVENGPSGHASASAYMRNGSGTSKVLHIEENQGSSGHIGLFVGSSDSSTGVLVTRGGNVGIGNIAPTSKLDVTGTVKATNFEGPITSATNVDSHFKIVNGNWSGWAPATGAWTTGSSIADCGAGWKPLLCSWRHDYLNGASTTNYGYKIWYIVGTTCDGRFQTNEASRVGGSISALCVKNN